MSFDTVFSAVPETPIPNSFASTLTDFVAVVDTPKLLPDDQVCDLVIPTDIDACELVVVVLVNSIASIDVPQLAPTACASTLRPWEMALGIS